MTEGFFSLSAEKKTVTERSSDVILNEAKNNFSSFLLMMCNDMSRPNDDINNDIKLQARSLMNDEQSVNNLLKQ